MTVTGNPFGGQDINRKNAFKDLVKFIDAPSPNIPFKDLPKNMRRSIDDVAKNILNNDSGKVVIMGGATSGKTSIVRHFAKNVDLYLKSTALDNLYVLNLSRIQDIRIAEGNGLRAFLDSICLSLHCDLEEICLYTESIDFVGYVHASNIPVKVILEVNTPTYIKLINNENQGLSKVWGTYEDVNADFLLPTIKELEKNLNLLKDELSNSIDSGAPDNSVSRFVKTFINKIPDEMVYHKDDEEEDENVIVNFRDRFENCLKVPIGIWSKAFRDMITHYAFSQENYDGEDSKLTDSIQKSLENNIFNFSEAIENFDTDGESVMESVMSDEGHVHVIQMGMMSADDDDDDEDEGPTKIDTTPFTFSNISTLSERLKNSIIGQTHAVDLVSESFNVPAIGFNDPTKPIRSFLFLGPTGVGKTELAKRIAAEVGKDQMNLIRLDMSEYSQSHEAVKLLGSPAGYVGYQDGGILTKQVQKHPKSLILLDEVEKAHPRTWDTFLQVLDAGRLTDNHGKTVDFTKTIIVLTSNLGAKEGNQESFGFFNGSDVNNRIMRRVEEFFKPEFINRIDDIIVFNKLSIESAEKIVEREIGVLSQRAKLKGIRIKSVSKNLVTHIIKDSGFNKYGARDIQRSVFRNVSQPLAKKLLTGKTRKKTFELDIDNSGISIL